MQLTRVVKLTGNYVLNKKCAHNSKHRLTTSFCGSLGFQDHSHQIQVILINTKENLMLLTFAVAILINSLQKNGMTSWYKDILLCT